MTDQVLSAEFKVRLSLSIPRSSTQSSVGGGGQLHVLVLLPPLGKNPGTDRIGGWVGPRAGLV